MKKTITYLLTVFFTLTLFSLAFAGGHGHHDGSSIVGWTYSGTEMGSYKAFDGCGWCANGEMGQYAAQSGEAGMEVKGKGLGGNFGYSSGYYQEQKGPGAYQEQWGGQYGEVWTK